MRKYSSTIPVSKVIPDDDDDNDFFLDDPNLEDLEENQNHLSNDSSHMNFSLMIRNSEKNVPKKNEAFKIVKNSTNSGLTQVVEERLAIEEEI